MLLPNAHTRIHTHADAQVTFTILDDSKRLASC